MDTKGKVHRLVRPERAAAHQSTLGLDGPSALIFASAFMFCSGCLEVVGEVDVDRPGESISIGPIKSPAACADDGNGAAACVESCAPGEQRCREALLQRCNDRGDGWEVADQCASSALCDGDGAQCLPAACATRQHMCTESGELLICRDDRTGFEHKDQCQSSAFCMADRGREGCGPACRAGRQRCNGAQIEQCREDRSGFDEVGEPCASASLCREGESELARCEAPTCNPGEITCDGERLLRCADEANAFLELRRCATKELCNLSGQRCEDAACAPGQQRCAGNVLLRCNTSQTAFVEFEACASALLCDPAAQRCLTVPPVVTPPAPPVLGTDPYTFINASGTAAVGLGPLTLRLPAQWTDIDQRAWTNAAGETLGPQFIASTNAARFAANFDIPGVYFAATARPPLDVATRLLEFDMSLRCTRGAAASYDDGEYAGTSQTWTNCAGTNATNVVVVGVPDERTFVTIVIVTILGERDQVARDEIWDSFLVQSP